jgi:hypothetical protein
VGIADQDLPAHDLFVSVWAGKVTRADWNAHTRRLKRSSPVMVRLRLTDIGYLDRHALTAADLPRLLEIYPNPPRPRRQHLGIVADPQWPLTTAIDHAHDQYPGLNSAVVNDLYTACHWLIVGADTVITVAADLCEQLLP